MTGAPHLREVRWRDEATRRRALARPAFPFDTRVVRAFDRLTLTRPVTVLVGENGSGKSTLLEAIALAADLPVVGAAPGRSDPSLVAQRQFAAALALAWTVHPHRGFFLRTEDYVGFVRRLAAERTALTDEIAERESTYRDADRSDHALALANGPARASLAGMTARYGDDLDACSHGEGLLRLLNARCVPGGLYVIDEPEAALSPQTQLSFLALVLERVAEGAQFLIASHAPIVLGVPDAQLLAVEDGHLVERSFDELPHVQLTRAFLDAPERFLRHLRPD